MNVKSAIESILFVSGEPVRTNRLAKVLNTKKQEIETALHELQNEYKGRGIVFLRKDDEWQLGTNPENARVIEKLVKSEFSESLSRAALETLTIIAYNGPLTRSRIEYVRGVNSVFTLRNLLLRGLIERIENPKDARSYLYRITFDFLKHLGIRDTKELPEYETLSTEVQKMLDEFKEEGQS